MFCSIYQKSLNWNLLQFFFNFELIFFRNYKISDIVNLLVTNWMLCTDTTPKKSGKWCIEYSPEESPNSASIVVQTKPSFSVMTVALMSLFLNDSNVQKMESKIFCKKYFLKTALEAVYIYIQ